MIRGVAAAAAHRRPNICRAAGCRMARLTVRMSMFGITLCPIVHFGPVYPLGLDFFGGTQNQVKTAPFLLHGACDLRRRTRRRPRGVPDGCPTGCGTRGQLRPHRGPTSPQPGSNRPNFRLTGPNHGPTRPNQGQTRPKHAQTLMHFAESAQTSLSVRPTGCV